ncbi:adenosine receptor A2b-like [Amphiura filiformis]|uniref:adenosine receptor A2b-like n=1 Tax=Amphiura filiformis TaxID=82378 RepID=UPI003B218B31
MLSNLVSVKTLAFVAIDRYVAIVNPLKYHMKMTNKVVAAMVAWTWSIAGVFSFSPLLGWGEYDYDKYLNVLNAVTNNDTRRNDTKAAKMLLIVIGTFFFCWTPTAMIIVCLTHGEGECDIFHIVFMKAGLTISMLNCAVNPVLYGVFNCKMRQAYRGLLCKMMTSRAGSSFSVQPEASNNTGNNE